MHERTPRADGSSFEFLATLALVVTGLYVARELLLPLALATLLAFLLLPLVRRLEMWRIPRFAAVLVVMTATALFCALLFIAIGGQMVALSRQLPQYRNNVLQKADDARAALQPALDRFEETNRFLRRLSRQASHEPSVDSEVNGTNDRGPSAANTGLEGQESETEAQPVEVQVVGGPSPSIETFRTWLGPVLSPFATASIVIVFSIFMLLEHHTIRNRFIVLSKLENVPDATRLLDDAARRVGRFLRMQLLVALVYGVSTGILTAVAGLPNALLWGFVGTLLRFVPFVGPLIATSLPIALSIATTEGWHTPIGLLLAFMALEFAVSNGIEPWLYGNTTGVSSLSVLLSALFWTWLWGGIGLVLAMPLTVFLVTLGRHVPQFSLFTTLLSDEDPLPPAVQLYQRLLASDFHAALQLVDRIASDDGLIRAGDLLLSCLGVGMNDLVRGRMSREQFDLLSKGARDSLHELSEEWQANDDIPAGPPVIAVAAARPGYDDIASEIVAATLTATTRGNAVTVPSTTVNDAATGIAQSGADVVVICATGPRGAQHAKYFLSRSAGIQHLVLSVLLVEGGELAAPVVGQSRDLKAEVVAASLADLAIKLQPYLESRCFRRQLAPAIAIMSKEGG